MHLMTVFWFHNDILLNISKQDKLQKYKVATGAGSQTLLIETIADSDAGNYSCRLINIIGSGAPEEPILLEVSDKL